jgi:hypothetical protein
VLIPSDACVRVGALMRPLRLNADVRRASSFIARRSRETRAALAARRPFAGVAARLNATDIALAIVVAFAGVFYEWTAQTSVSGPSLTSVYYLLAGALLHLHTYLPLHVPAGLAALADPYNTAANGPFVGGRLHDLAYYHGHFYSPWGPVPAIALYLPLRLLGIQLTDANAVAVFSILALLFSVLLLRFLVRRFVPTARGWTVVVGACALAFATAIPFVLRRPAIYEADISSGACFAMAALYLLARGLFDRSAPRTGLLAGASLLAGLAASRPPLLLLGPLLVTAAVFVGRQRGTPRSARRRIATALLGPWVLCVILLAAYNTQRFGSPTQFGSKYQLNGSFDQYTQPTFQLSFIEPGLYNYLLDPPRLALTFPHVFLPPPPAYPGTLPSDYTFIEPTGGILPMAPIVLFAAAAPLFWRRRKQLGGELPLIVAALWLLAVGVMVGLAFTIWGTTERFEVDFDLFLILAGVLGWIGLLPTLRGRLRRRLATICGVAAIIWSCFTGVAVSFTGYYNLLDVLHPGLFADLEDLTGPLATLPTMLLGHPVLARVQSPAPVAYAPTNYTTFGEGRSSTSLGEGPVTLVVLAPGAESLALEATVVRGSVLPASAPLRIVVRSPGRRAITMPVQPGLVFLPIHVGWGLNRIELGLAGAHPRGIVIGIDDLVLHSRPDHHGVGSAKRRDGHPKA